MLKVFYHQNLNLYPSLIFSLGTLITPIPSLPNPSMSYFRTCYLDAAADLEHMILDVLLGDGDDSEIDAMSDEKEDLNNKVQQNA